MGFKQLAFKALHFAKLHSPEIMLGASIVTGAAALYFTVRGTLKLEEILDDHKERIDDVKSEMGDVESSEHPEEIIEYKKQLAKEYVKTGGKVALAYAPALGLAGASAVLSIAAHGVMKKRVATTLAALESTTAAFEAYRQRVKDRYGEEVERDILTGKHQESVAVETTDKKGNTKMVDQKVDMVDNLVSQYARYFDNKNDMFYCTMYNDGSGRAYNEEILASKQKTCDLLLRSKGYLFLNEVYDELGFEPTPEGQLVGWLLNGDGDCHVSFNINKIVEAPNENDDVWLLDFNVDGIIVDKI